MQFATGTVVDGKFVAMSSWSPSICWPSFSSSARMALCVTICARAAAQTRRAADW